MIDGVTHLMSAFQAFRQQGSWTGRRADNIVDGGAPFYGSYATKDGKFIAVGAIEPQFYASRLKVMGIDRELLPEQNDRPAWPQMRDLFAKIFATRTRDEWVELATGRDACLAPVLTIDEAPGHPQMQTRDVYTMFDGIRHPGPAPRFSRTLSELRRPTPAPGSDSQEALADWGMPPERARKAKHDQHLSRVAGSSTSSALKPLFLHFNALPKRDLAIPDFFGR